MFSAVRCNGMGKVGFLADYRRTNVMLTRAKRYVVVVVVVVVVVADDVVVVSGLVVVGAPDTLRHDRYWNSWLAWVHQVGVVVDPNTFKRSHSHRRPADSSYDNNDRNSKRRRT